MTIFVSANGQTGKKVIEDAWVYLGSWAEYSTADTVDLVKSWITPTICGVSFEKGVYSASDENGQTKEKGKWEIKKTDKQDVIIITIDNGQTIRFKVITVDNRLLRLKRVT